MKKKARPKRDGSSDEAARDPLLDLAFNLVSKSLEQQFIQGYVEQQEEGGAGQAKVNDPPEKGDGRPMRKGRKKQPRDADARVHEGVKDGGTWDCWHYNNQDVSRLNKARLHILSCKGAVSCENCHRDSPTSQHDMRNKQIGGKKKKKKGSDARRGATKEKAKAEESHMWVCLECKRQFCGGPDICNPLGHVKAHCYEQQHWWSAQYDDPTLVYCFKCGVEIVLQIPEFSPLQKKDEPEASLKPKNTDADKYWDWNSDSDWGETTTAEQLDPAEILSHPSDQNDVLEMDLKLSPPIVSQEGQGAIDPAELSCPPSDQTDYPEISLKLSPAIAKQDIHISGSASSCMNVIKGLPNIGNTCFLNSMLQNLLPVDSLRRKILGPDIWSGPLSESLKQLFIQTSTSYDADLNPENHISTILSKLPQFTDRTRHHDCNELFVLFLDSLDAEEVNARILSSLDDKEPEPDDSNNGNVATIVDLLFRGNECSTVSSFECPHGSTKPQGFLVLQLSIPSVLHPSIEDCFKFYTEQEIMPDWHCEECTDAAKNDICEDSTDGARNNMSKGEKDKKNNVYRAAGKRILITRTPDVLVVTLNRYVRRSDGTIEKLEGHVRFNEMLDMQPYMNQGSDKSEKNIYRLVAVTEHSGTIDRGHYVVYARAAKMEGQQQQSSSKSWFFASDNFIKKASMQEVLHCDAYILVYERCSSDDFLSSANLTGEESQLISTNTWPQTGVLSNDPIPPPLDELWEIQRNPKRDKRREEELDRKYDIVALKIWVFLDRFTISEDTTPYYRFQLMTMVASGFGSRELNIPYSHLLLQSKDLAMEVCNSYDRLRVRLTATAKQYMQALVKKWKFNVTENARGLMDHLELKVIGMPKVHEELKVLLSTNLLREDTHVFGHEEDEDPIMIPVPEKCALVRDLLAHVVGKHMVGYSWEGDFDIVDMDVYDGKVIITKEPKLFEIQPQISDEMIVAMEKDFTRIEATVVKRFYLYKTYVPYLKSFRALLCNVGLYKEWWKNKEMAKALREWILHYLFLKPSMARLNLLIGIYTACRAYDAGDDTALFKMLVEHEIADQWIEDLLETENPVLLKVFKYKDVPADKFWYYQFELEFLFEYLRHLPIHGAENSFEYTPLAKRGDGPRKQLMQSLEELELASAFRLEKHVNFALFLLVASHAMKGMLFSVWDCYKRTN